MNNWSAERDPIGNGAKIALHYGKQALPFATLFELLATDSEFADWYSALLRHSGYTAFFWEHPPMTEASLVEPAEFVLLAAPMLDSIQADARPFAEHFDAARAGGRKPAAVSFANIGGDALLIAPCPDSSSRPYPHLGAFLRNAPARQIHEFWRLIAELVLEHLGEKPLWLSTSGLGVAWLHVRLDSRPKYYQYRPYVC